MLKPAQLMKKMGSMGYRKILGDNKKCPKCESFGMAFQNNNTKAVGYVCICGWKEAKDA